MISRAVLFVTLRSAFNTESWYFFSSHAFVNVFGTHTTTFPSLIEEMKVFLNQVVKFALDNVSSSSPRAACHVSAKSIDQKRCEKKVLRISTAASRPVKCVDKKWIGG